MQERFLTKQNALLGILFLGQLLLSLNDFYFSGLGFPIVPVFGTVLIVIATLMLPRPALPEGARTKHQTLLIGLLLCLLIFASSFWGLAAFKSATLKGPMGICFGILLYCILMLHEDNPQYKERLFQNLKIILVIHLIAWFVQFLSFTMFHNFLDYLQPITGTKTRHGAPLEELVTKLERFSGLFAEPAAYVTFIFTGVSIRMIRSEWKLSLLDALLIASILASLAITGYLLVFVLLALWASKLLRTPRAWAILGLIVCVLAMYVSTQLNSPVAKIIILRVAAPSSDASLRVRTENAIESYTNLPESGQVFGAGFGNYGLSENVSNGVLNLLIFLGVLGTPIVSGIFVWLLRLRRFPWTVWLFISMTLPLAPPFTLAHWWMWIGMMVLFGQDAHRARLQALHAPHEANTPYGAALPEG